MILNNIYSKYAHSFTLLLLVCVYKIANYALCPWLQSHVHDRWFTGNVSPLGPLYASFCVYALNMLEWQRCFWNPHMIKYPINLPLQRALIMFLCRWLGGDCFIKSQTINEDAVAHNATTHVKLLIRGDGVCGVLPECLVNLFISAQHGWMRHPLD